MTVDYWIGSFGSMWEDIGIIASGDKMYTFRVVERAFAAIKAERAATRLATIEECALVADDLADIYDGRAIRDAIRALSGPTE